MDEILQYFGLNESPFRIGPDPRFLFLSDQVKEALAKCEYMTRERVGPLYMYGPIGSGKTSIMRRLYERLGSDEAFTVKLLISPNLKSSNAFLRLIMDEFNVKTERSYGRSLRNLENFLLDQHKKKKIPVLLVDEAQNMTRDALKLLHYLLNFETNEVKLLQIVLSGQEELAAKVVKYKELASRMFPIAMLAMSFEDLKSMMEFRWNTAKNMKTDSPLPFPETAIKAVFTSAKGLPREAVKLADESLRFMYSNDSHEITAKDVEKLAKSLNIT